MSYIPNDGSYNELTTNTYEGGEMWKAISGSSAATITIDAAIGGVLFIYNSGSATTINFKNTSNVTVSFTINASGTNGGVTGFGIVIASGKYNIIPDTGVKFLSVPVANTAPTASSVAFTGTATAGQTLTGTYTYADADSDTEGASVKQWYRSDNTSGLNRTAISGATNSTYVLQAGDVGKYIQFAVTPVASTGVTTGTQVFSAYSTAIGSAPLNAAPTATSVSITGTQTQGQTLTGHYTYADADSDAEGTSTFKWYRADNGSGLNRAAISGATSSTYVLQAGDVGKYIQFGVTPVAATGTSTGSEALSSYTGAIAAGSTTDTDAQAFIDAVTLAGGTFSAGLQTKLHSFYIAAKGNGYYTKLKAAYFPLSANANGNKVNMITPGTRDLTYGGSAISHASDGMDFNTSGYADTGFDPSVLLTANNTHLSYYSTENTSGAYVEMGVNTAAYAIRFDLLVSLSGDAYSMMNSSGTWATVANANSSGFYVGSRTSSTVHKLYKNGTEIASTATAESAALPNGPVFLGAWNLLGTGAQNNTDRKMAFASIGQGLSPTEAGNFSTDLAALLAP